VFITCECASQSINAGSPIVRIKEQRAPQIDLLTTALVFNPLNPEVLLENKRVWFGLTKEISLGKYPFGRLAFEYTYIFRGEDNNHYRVSYNYDIPIQAGDFAAAIISIGVGYFTDSKKTGFFPQAGLGILIGVTDNLAADLYVKSRHTFMTDRSRSDITDLSLGIGAVFYLW
jgi:hypothetical protein